MLRADGFGFLPVVLLWAFAVAAAKISQAAKKARASQPGPDGESPVSSSRQDSLREQLRAAMEELKQAESQSKRSFTVTLQPPAPPPPRRPLASSIRSSISPAVDPSVAFARLEEMQKDAAARRGATPAIRPPAIAPSTPVAADAAAPAAPNPLAAYADGTARGAFIVSEILARPRGESL